MVERKAPTRKTTAKPKQPPDSSEPTADISDGSEPHAGYVGQPPDETPNEHYSLLGVIQGLPVPEHNR